MSVMQEYLKKYGNNTVSTPRLAAPISSAGAGNGTMAEYLQWLEEEERRKRLQQATASATLGLGDDDDEDIAPVDDSLLDFFQKGSFADGFDWHDIPSAILGTAGDAALNIGKGALGIVEGLGDLAVYGVAGVADAMGNDDLADNARKNASVNLVDKLTGGVEDYLNQYSVLGRTSDAILQGVGQVGTIMATGGLGASAGLGQAGVTALTTGLMGVSGVGSGMGEAYQSGASDEDAFTYGLISGAADALSELMFGGMGKGMNALGFNRGLLSADDLLAKKVSGLFSRQIAKNFAEFGIKASAEGLEEVVAGIAQAIGKKTTYMSEEEFGDILKDENLLEQFIVGTVTSGISQSGIVPGMKQGSLIESNQTGRDFVTGYTQTEQAVIDKAVENRIKAREENGQTVTHKDRSDIEAEVKRLLDRGYLDADEIESILGGEEYTTFKTEMGNFFASDDYKAYKQAEKAEADAKAEFDPLVKMKQGEMTGEQIYRRDELKKILDESKVGELKSKIAPEATRIAQLRNKMRGNVQSMVQGTRMAESYNELARKQQKFQVDVNQYTDENAKKTVQSILDSGLGDNSNQFHETVDFLAKLSADKGVVFDLTNNEKLKGTEHYKEGYWTHGFVSDDGNIVLNYDSPRALNTTVGHEITHVLEKAGVYKELSSAVRNYAISKEGLEKYNARIKEAEKIYRGKKNTTAEGEVTADLIGEYLFTDYEFISNLSTSNRNVFQKIYDEIKYMVKIATAGSNEARELLKAKKMFDKAYRENVKGKPETAVTEETEVTEADNATAEEREFSDADVKYSIRKKDPPKNVIEGFKVFVVKDGKLFPPMVANPEGEGTPVGVWLDADVGGLSYDKDGNVKLNNRGRFKVKAGGKGTQGSGGDLAFRPGWHLGEYPDASQFGRENEEHLVPNKKGEMVPSKELFPYNFVWARCEVAADENYQLDAMSFGVNENGKFERSQAGLPYIPEDGYYKYRTNADPNTAPWIISGSIKVVEILNDDQVAAECAKHGVTPQQRQGFTYGSKSLQPEKRPGGKIDLSMFGLTEGMVTPTSEDALNQIRATEDMADTRKAETLELLKTLPGYAKRQIDFDDENIIKEFGMNNQDVNEYRQMAEESGHSYLNDDKIYSGGETITEEQNEQGLDRVSETQYSLSKDTDNIYSRIFEAQEEVGKLDRAIRDFEDSAEFKEQMASIFSGDDIATNIQKYQEFLDTSGYGAMKTKLDALREELETLRKESEKAFADESAEKEKAAVEKSGLSEADYFRKQAVKEFGYTPYFYDAGYITPNGKMLNFSGEKGKHFGSRGQDHRGIGIIYENTQGSEAMVRFMNDGNIRIMGETPGLDISSSVAPTNEQYALIRKFARESEKGGYFAVDISDEKGRNIGSYEYNGRVNADRVVNDIKYFFQNGKVRESSRLADFLSISKEGAKQSIHGDYHVYGSDFGVNDPLADFAPVANTAPVSVTAENASIQSKMQLTDEKDAAPVADGIQIRTVKEKLTAKLNNRQTELANIEKHRADTLKSLDEKIAKAQASLDSKKNKDTKVANTLKKRIEKLQRLKADIDAGYAKRIADIKKSIDKTSVELEKDHTERDRYERAVARINAMLKYDTEALNAEYAQKKADLQSRLADKDSYISNTARELYDELRGLRKGVRASEKLASLLDGGFDWGNLRSALSNVRYTPTDTVNPNSAAERAVRQLLNESYESDMESINDLDVELAEKIHQLEVKAEEDRKNARTANQRKLKMEEHSQFWKDLIGDTYTWKDLPLGLAYKTRTLRRILRKVVKDANGNADIAKADAIYDALETKYDHNEALLKKESQRLKKTFFKLKLTHEEDAYAQMLGELRHNPDTTLTEDVVKEYYEKHKGKIDTNKVNRAIAETRKTYDELFERLNAALREQGMKEIPYRQGYFPHFTNPKQNWFEKLMNWKPINSEIPTSIAGLTDQFKPQRSWQSFNKQRMGDKTDYSLYKGLDTYIHGALDWIYHIDDLQSRRALENHLRYTHSDEGIKARIEEIKANDTYDADEAQKMIDAVLAEANNPLGGLVRELMNRTNTLANKKSSMDRGMEDFTNRKIYSTLTNLNNRVTANQVVGSLSSALTNFIPMVQSWHQVSPLYTVRGLGDMIRSTIQDDGMVAKSDFLTNRLIEEEKLYKTGWDKVSDKAAFMMNVVDGITSQTVWRSKYLQNLHEGMSESQAIKDADQFAKNLIAGRSRGNAPTIFDAKNPIVKIFTAFQLEVANQYGYMFEDVPQDTESKARLVKGYATAFLGAYMYNALYSSLVGRDAAFDPLSILEDLLKDLFGDDEEEPEEIIMNLADNILEETPYIGGLLGGGRVPISSALPYSSYSNPFQSMLTDVTDGDWANFGKQLLKPLYYLAMPVAGGQIKKTAEGLGMFLGDHPISGSYTDSGKLRFPVEATFGNVLQAGLFGQYASQNAREYFDESRSPLGEKQIEEFMESGLPIHDYWEYREGLSGLSKLDEKADYIAGLDLPIDTKNLFINNIADRDEDIDLTGFDAYGDFEEFDFAIKYPEKYEIAQAVGGYEAYMTYQEGMKDMKLAEKVDYVAGLDLTVEQKNALINGETDRKEPIDLTGYENFSSFEEFEYAKKNPGGYAVAQAVGGYEAYRAYTDAIGDIHGDKDEYGQTISGSRKEKVAAYIYSLDIPEIEQHILFKMEYNSDDDNNEEIIEYLNNRGDISAEEMTDILLQLGFLVDSEGNIYW